MDRGSGILMHISSLPELYGIGTLGKSAYLFADFLRQSGQKYWQILPLGHTGYGDSPYQSFSAYAGNPYFIDLATLYQDGLLTKEELEALDPEENSEKVDYGKLFNTRYPVLKKAYKRAKVTLHEEIEGFISRNKAWLDEYTLYMAVKEEMGNKSWLEWDEPIRLRQPEAIKYYKEKLKEQIEFWAFIQYEFYKQWNKLKAYVNTLDIQIIGDLPIYVAVDSSDVWAHPEVFRLDKDHKPIVVAGCPPDAFTEDGQLWGNPIYDWDYLERTGYAWWINRMQEASKLYDVIRIDHFRGFESYWAVPYGDQTAKGGKWVKGPGIKLFNAIEKALGKLNIIAEDLGFMTAEVLKFREETGYPGMKVLQFGFDIDSKSDYIPHNCGKNSIMYTGTHDNNTIRGWLASAENKAQAEYAKKYLKLDEKETYHLGFIRGAWASTCVLALTQMQDVLGLDDNARMNTPGTMGGNWIWRMKKDVLTDELSMHINEITKLYGRSLT
ncbi:4-alpha-glucanotransferase [Niameybacter massiliensis]|uniref:4-alpha-glucanotransferase n=1 Tax=Holtiella tumoricola TaxID=3018743 RepID=A0AA42J2I7_9FIRM|nr:4-alpha-glucanotransferase [Holtiella tumoricola]MDA3733248.1 4-alpha-glucanotransferase [Holtiella tumoricola]